MSAQYAGRLRLSARFMRSFLAILFLPLFAHAIFAGAQTPASSLGVFEGHSDIGTVTPAGTFAYSAKTGAYTLTAAGWDLWAAEDDFQFAWKKLSGDMSITADIDFPVKEGVHHRYRKAMLMFRQTLDMDAKYADAAVHGAGMTALQYRRAKGASTQDIEIRATRPKRLRLEKRGDVFTMFVSSNGEPLHQVGASINMHFDEPFYVGIGVSAHNREFPEKAVFSNLEIKPLAAPTTSTKLVLYSTLQTLAVADAARQATVVLSEPAQLAAPNWSHDGSTIYFTRSGRIDTIPAAGGTPQELNVGGLVSCSGSHGFSPDGKLFALSCATPDRNDRRVFIVPASGGTPRQLTENVGYFHSWSPDGKTILYTRGTKGGLTIYAISVDGGPETALSDGKGVSDDPDYSPDGKWIYFNTDRWGGMQIARMRPDGSGVEQTTHDEYKNWTPHPSPDGKSVVFLSYDPSVTTHAANKDVALRILSPEDGKIRTLVNLVGGEGTMNVANWAPDSTHIAFVSFQMLPAEDTGSTQ